MILLLMILFTCSPHISSITDLPSLKLVKRIAHSDESYSFFTVTQAMILPDRHLLVADSKRHSLMLYDWNGDFIKKFGRRGQGPGDFLSFNSLMLSHNEICIYDHFNKRITEFKLDLTKFLHRRFVGLHHQGKPVTRQFYYCFKLDDKLYLGVFFSDAQSDGRLCIVDDNLQILSYFFNDSQLEGNYEEGTRFYLLPVVCIDDSTRTIMATLSFPDTDILFRKYSYSGELISTFRYKQADRFTFSRDLLDYSTGKKKTLPDPYYLSMISRMLCFQNHYLVILGQEEKETGQQQSSGRTLLLLFTEEGTLKHTFNIDPKLKIHSISKDGYLVCSKFDDDEENYFVYIYQLKI